MEYRDNNKFYTLRRFVSGQLFDFENLVQKRIVCTSPKKFNDPIDTYFYFSDDKCFVQSKKLLTPDIMDRIRVCCFINQNEIKQIRKGNKLISNELLMWTHYANAHEGMCLEFEIPIFDFQYIEPHNSFDETKKILYKINYIDGLATNFEELFSYSENFEELIGSCFFTKDDAFSYEKEMRLLIFESEENYKKNFHCPLEFNYLKKIIFGKRCSDDMKYLVSCINKQVYDNKIELYYITKYFTEEKYNV